MEALRLDKKLVLISMEYFLTFMFHFHLGKMMVLFIDWLPAWIKPSISLCSKANRISNMSTRLSRLGISMENGFMPIDYIKEGKGYIS